jgi:Flp pilus assembly protein TadD
MFLAQYYLDNRDWQTAAQMLEKARDIEPENPSIHQNLGIAYRGLARYDDAKREYERAMALDPKNVEPMLNLAVMVGDYQQQYDTAIDYLERYQKAGGKNPALAKQWIADIEKTKERITRAKEREAKEAERKKASDERAKKAAQHEEDEKRWAEEDAKKGAEGTTEPSEGQSGDDKKESGGGQP